MTIDFAAMGIYLFHVVAGIAAIALASYALLGARLFGEQKASGNRWK